MSLHLTWDVPPHPVETPGLSHHLGRLSPYEDSWIPLLLYKCLVTSQAMSFVHGFHLNQQLRFVDHERLVADSTGRSICSNVTNQRSTATNTWRSDHPTLSNSNPLGLTFCAKDTKRLRISSGSNSFCTLPGDNGNIPPKCSQISIGRNLLEYTSTSKRGWISFLIYLGHAPIFFRNGFGNLPLQKWCLENDPFSKNGISWLVIWRKVSTCRWYNYTPQDPHMVYWPTFTIKINQM